jgi:CrcB protein
VNGNDEELPLDPDLDAAETATGSSRPIHLRPGALLLVFVGGTLGTAAREALSLAIPPLNGIPYAIFGINIVGALLLGVLLESLVRRGPDHGGRQRLRLLLGTGVMGGFTTYSALALDSARLIGSGTVGAGAAYAVGTVLVGAAATWTGIALAAAAHRRTRPVPNGETR